jgi:AraC-like DNA-binding protein
METNLLIKERETTTFSMALSPQTNDQEPPEQDAYTMLLDRMSDYDQDLKEKVLSHILQNPADASFGVDSLGQLLGLGRTKMFKEIKRITGMSPHHLILKVKMEEASRLLIEEPSLPITLIAKQLGYSLSGLEYAFKHYYGVSPKDVRTHKLEVAQAKTTE